MPTTTPPDSDAHATDWRSDEHNPANESAAPMSPAERAERERLGGQAADGAHSETQDGGGTSESTGRGFYKGREDRSLRKDAKNIRRVAKRITRQFSPRKKKFIYGTLALNLFVFALVLFIGLILGPWKHIHFETVMRSANFARFQLMVHKQAAHVVFQAAVLDEKSVGAFRRSPLVNQILLTTPDRQVKALARDNRVKWEFYPNQSFGHEVIPGRESLKAVIIDGERIDLDSLAQESFGKNLSDLTTRERWTVKSLFVERVQFKLGDIMAIQSRWVRWNPYKRLRLRAGVHLVKWLNNARAYAGKSPQQAKTQNIEETLERVPAPEAERPKSLSSDVEEAAKEAREHLIEDIQTGTAPTPGELPGDVRSKLAERMKFLGEASDIVFALTVSCIVHDLSNSFKEYQDEREMQATRMAADLMTTTDQIKTGDTTGEAIGAANGMWDANGAVPDAMHSVTYQRATGQTVAPTAQNDLMEAAIPWIKPATKFAEGIQEVDLYLSGGIIGLSRGELFEAQQNLSDNVCATVLNQYVQYGVAAVELVALVLSLGTIKGITAGIKAGISLGVNTIIGYGLGEALNWLIKQAVMEFTGMSFSGIEQGAQRYDTGSVAEDLVSQTGNRNIVYGRPMTAVEAGAAQTVAMEKLRSENAKKPFAERYFAIDNPFSLLGLTIARIPVSTGGLYSTVRDTGSIIGTVLSSPMRMIGALGNTGLIFSPAHAAGIGSPNNTHGVQQWGWSVDEQARIEQDPSFSLESLIPRVEPRMAELDGLYGPCYDDNTFVLQSERPEQCKPSFLKTDDALYWRYYNFLMSGAVRMEGAP